MAAQMTFQRYELKYLLTPDQKQAVLQAMEGHMALDQYGRGTIRNIYYDTDTFRLIRRSLERPCYKEKLRVRSYRQVTPEEPVFVELKKKYKSVVYKRRLALPEGLVSQSLAQNAPLPDSSQIGREIDYFRSYYRPLIPTVFLSYQREAYYPLDGGDFRVTFDDHILYRRDRLFLCSEVSGTPILPPGQTLMEIKTSGGIPLWMTHVLTRAHIFKTSYSKYGTAYQHMTHQHLLGGLRYA